VQGAAGGPDVEEAVANLQVDQVRLVNRDKLDERMIDDREREERDRGSD
jgi:hypothetical protein